MILLVNKILVLIVLLYAHFMVDLGNSDILYFIYLLLLRSV